MLLEGMLEVISEFFNANLATEVRKGMTQNEAELEMVSANIQAVSVPEEYIASAKYDMQTMIGPLDAEVPNPQMLNQLTAKFISRVFIQRETKQLYMTLQLRMDDEILLDKTVVTGM